MAFLAINFPTSFALSDLATPLTVISASVAETTVLPLASHIRI
jgi:hypothetical protein